MSIFDIFSKFSGSNYYEPSDDIEFIDSVGTFANNELTSIKLAKDVDPECKKYQKQKYNEYVFANCPGMLEYSRIGYIVPSWCTIKIKANKAGTVSYDNITVGPTSSLKKSDEFQYAFIEGVVNNNLNYPKIFKYPAPWRIRTKKDITISIAPALYHNSKLNDVFFPPGIVHYEKFYTLNAVMMPKTEREITINIGEPLIQIIPTRVNNFSANFGYSKEYKHEPILSPHPGYWSGKSWYVKHLRKKISKYQLKHIQNKKQ